MNILAGLIGDLREAMSMHMQACHVEQHTKRRVMRLIQRLGEHQHAVGELKENVLVGYVNREDGFGGIQAEKDEEFDTPVYVALMIADGDEDEEDDEDEDEDEGEDAPCGAN